MEGRVSQPANQSTGLWRVAKTVFFNLLRIKASFRTKQIWRHPNMTKMTIWGTLSDKALIKRQLLYKIIWHSNIWRNPWHLYMAPLCATAPWLGFTGPRCLMEAPDPMSFSVQHEVLLGTPISVFCELYGDLK